MKNTTMQDKSSDTLCLETCRDFYEGKEKDDLILLGVELVEKMIVFSISWVEHDLSIAAITTEQAKTLIDKLKLMVEKVEYEEMVEYYNKYKKIKLKRNKDQE